MAASYYLCPVELLYAVGEGRFSLTDPGGARATRGARALAYGTWDQARGTRCTLIHGGGPKGTGKSWGIARIEDSDPASGLIDTFALDLDAACVAFPAGVSLLNTEVQALPTAVQDAITSRLTALRVPTTWITPTTTVRQIVGRVIRLLFCAQQLGTDYPELDLAATWNTIPGSQRTRILTWATSQGVSTTGLTSSTPIRTILDRLVTANFGVITFGGETF